MAVTSGPSSASQNKIALELNVRAVRALSSGSPGEAVELLRQAVVLDAKNIAFWLNLAAAYRMGGDIPAALKAVENALALEPREFLGLLVKASLLERAGQLRKAATIYCKALAVAPPEDRLDGPTRKALIHAREVEAQHARELGDHIRDKFGSEQLGLAVSGSESMRVERFIDLLAGRARHFPQQPSGFFYPGQPAIEFWDREEFPWLADFEAATPAIREELAGVIGDTGSFTPYIEYPNGIPLDQWAELNHSPRWSAFHFYHYGRRYEDNCARCPRTMEALATLPQPVVQGRMPAAMFSVLRPKTHIPAHTGVANVRLVAHLPLVVPEGCRFRVGNETREWRPGAAWVFDDTIEHEAWNDSDQDRVILICDVWNPRLSVGEREAIAELMVALDEFNGVDDDAAGI